MRLRAWMTAAAVLTVSSLQPIAAHAEDKDTVTETARRRFLEGVRYFDQKRYEEARAAFLQAYALKQHPAVLLNLAQSEVRSGHSREAARDFSRFLRESTSASATEKSEAEKGLATARAKLGKIQITVNVPGADVLVDGESVGAAPLPEPVDETPGSHSIVAKYSGHIAQTDVSVSMGRTTSTSLSLEMGGTVAAAPPPATPAPAATPVSAEPVGEPTPAAPAPAAEPPKETPLPPAAAEVSPSTATGEREPFFHWLTHSGAGLAGLSVTALGVVVGAGFSIAGSAASSNVDSVTSAIQAESQLMGMSTSVPCSPVANGFQKACDTLKDNM
ncbi:MAG TPA: PEGA domain-containing protein, partial [Polyangiaceae bacterium]